MGLLSSFRTIAKLVKYGYLAYEHVDDLQAIRKAVKAFLAFTVGSDGDVDSDSYLSRVLNETRCGCADVASFTDGTVTENVNSPYKWDMAGLPIKIWIDALPGLSKPSWDSVLKDATSMWSDVCGVTFEIVTEARVAELIIVSAAIDGPSGVLADCELPTGIQRQRALKARMDKGEAWAMRAQQRMLSAPLVLGHELGHGIGLMHIPVSLGVAWMNPMYNDRLTGPTQLDIAEAVGRYGPKRAIVPTPIPPVIPVPPTPSVGYSYVIRSDSPISIDGHRILPK